MFLYLDVNRSADEILRICLSKGFAVVCVGLFGS